MNDGKAAALTLPCDVVVTAGRYAGVPARVVDRAVQEHNGRVYLLEFDAGICAERYRRQWYWAPHFDLVDEAQATVCPRCGEISYMPPRDWCGECKDFTKR